MVQILPQFDPGGEIGKSLGSGIGQGLEQVAQRKLLQEGVGNLQGLFQKSSETGEPINPLQMTLSLMSQFAGVPGGLQALGELAPSIHKEINRHNLSLPRNPQKAGGQRQRVVPGQNRGAAVQDSVVEGADIITDDNDYDLSRPEDQWEAVFQEELSRTGDPELASQNASKRLDVTQQVNAQRFQEYQNKATFLDKQMSESFPTGPNGEGGLSAPFKNELAKEYYQKTKKM